MLPPRGAVNKRKAGLNAQNFGNVVGDGAFDVPESSAENRFFPQGSHKRAFSLRSGRQVASPTKENILPRANKVGFRGLSGEGAKILL